jgi:hypothetical protein
VPAGAQAKWEKLSPDDVSITSAPDYGLVSGAPAVLWPATPATDSVPHSIELRTVAPTLAHPAGGAGPLATPVANWNAVGPSPVFAPGSRILFQAFDHASDGNGGTFVTDPFTTGSAELPYSKAGSERSGDLDAVDAGGGALLWADSSRGELSIYRSSGPGEPARAAELQGALGGCCAYHPVLDVRQDGQPWVAWYSNAAANTGLFMAPLDAATGASAGAPVKVPGSETVANNFARLPLVCRNICQVFYATQPSAAGPTELASWAPGDNGSVHIPGADDLTLNAVIAAAQTSTGRTWLAWYDRGPSGSSGGYRARLGDSRGLGEKPFTLPAPGGAKAFGPLFAVDRGGDDLLLGAVASPGGATGGALWLDMVTPKGDPAIPNKNGFTKPKVARARNAIAVVSGVQSRRAIKHGGVRVGVQGSRAGTKATLVLCATRAGHPPSPCRKRAARFSEPGFKTVHLPPGPPTRGQRGFKLTLRSGGKSRSLALKLRR